MIQSQVELLNELGVYINYNGYGGSLDDLYFTPEDLYKSLHPYTNPLDFIASEDTFDVLKSGYSDDMSKGTNADYHVKTNEHAVIILPD